MDELKPCPFCGCTEIGVYIEMEGDFAVCDDCDNFSDLHKWNTRPLEDAKDAEIARLREALKSDG